MIIQRRGGELLLVRQTDHCALSGVLAEHWGNDVFARPEPRAAVVLAAARHDEGWREWEAAPRVNPATRRPYNFTEMPPQDHLPFYLRGIDRVVAQDRYAGLLVNLHLSGLYRKRYGLDHGMSLERVAPGVRPVVEDYLRKLDEQQKQLREQVRRDSSVPDEDVEELAVWTNYRLLQVYDLFSLYFCMGPPRDYTLRHVPVNPTRADTELALRPAGGNAMTVEPYPFDAAPLRVGVEAAVVPDRDYAGDDDLRRTLAAAQRTTLSFELRPVT